MYQSSAATLIFQLCGKTSLGMGDVHFRKLTLVSEAQLPWMRSSSCSVRLCQQMPVNHHRAFAVTRVTQALENPSEFNFRRTVQASSSF